MKRRPIVIVGAGGHGREILDAVSAAIADGAELEIVGVLADGERHPERLIAHGVELLGGVVLLTELDADYIVAIGSPQARSRIDVFAMEAGRSAATIVHPGASLGTDVRLAPGSYVGSGAVITTNVTLGRHAHVNVGATISHDCSIGSYATIGPGCHLAGRVDVGDYAALGAGCLARPGSKIGERAVLGTGSVVISDIAPACTAFGVPARPIPRELGARTDS